MQMLAQESLHLEITEETNEWSKIYYEANWN